MVGAVGSLFTFWYTRPSNRFLIFSLYCTESSTTVAYPLSAGRIKDNVLVLLESFQGPSLILAKIGGGGGVGGSLQYATYTSSEFTGFLCVQSPIELLLQLRLQCMYGILCGAGAKFSPRRRTFSLSVSVSAREDRFTTHLL